MEARLKPKPLEVLTQHLDFQAGDEFDTTAKVQKIRDYLKQVMALSKMFGCLGCTRPNQRVAPALRTAMEECVAIGVHISQRVRVELLWRELVQAWDDDDVSTFV